MVSSSILNTCIIGHAVKFQDQGYIEYFNFHMKAKEVSKLRK